MRQSHTNTSFDNERNITVILMYLTDHISVQIQTYFNTQFGFLKDHWIPLKTIEKNLNIKSTAIPMNILFPPLPHSSPYSDHTFLNPSDKKSILSLHDFSFSLLPFPISLNALCSPKSSSQQGNPSSLAELGEKEISSWPNMIPFGRLWGARVHKRLLVNNV